MAFHRPRRAMFTKTQPDPNWLHHGIIATRAPNAGHRLVAAHRVVGSARLGGLQHYYELEPIAA